MSIGAEIAGCCAFGYRSLRERDLHLHMECNNCDQPDLLTVVLALACDVLIMHGSSQSDKHMDWARRVWKLLADLNLGALSTKFSLDCEEVPYAYHDKHIPRKDTIIFLRSDQSLNTLTFPSRPKKPQPTYLRNLSCCDDRQPLGDLARP